MAEEDKEIEKINSYRKANDYSSLLREYRLNADTDDKEITPYYKNYLFDLLKNDLENIENAWPTLDVSGKEHAIAFLKDMDDETSLNFLWRRLFKEENSYIQPQITEAICLSEKLAELKGFLIDSINKIMGMGRRFEILAEILSYFEDPHFLKISFLTLKRRCPQRNDSCHEDIFYENAFFVGQPFLPKMKEQIRPSINRAVFNFDKSCSPYYADMEIAGDFLCKICKKIQCTRFGIYDISTSYFLSILSRKIFRRHKFPNPNVMLELGMALAFGKKTIIIMKTGQSPPSDLNRTDIIFYSTPVDLENKLTERLPQVLGNI